MSWRRNRWMGAGGCCPPKRIVYPTKCDVVHCCTEETIEHVHPSHTTVCNHHLIKNRHVFPHTTSQEFSTEEVNMIDPGCGPMPLPPHGGCHGHRRGWR